MFIVVREQIAKSRLLDKLRYGYSGVLARTAFLHLS